MKSGIEIKPLGWVALAILIGIAIYLIFYRKKPKRDQSEQRKISQWSL